MLPGFKCTPATAARIMLSLFFLELFFFCQLQLFRSAGLHLASFCLSCLPHPCRMEPGQQSYNPQPPADLRLLEAGSLARFQAFQDTLFDLQAEVQASRLEIGRLHGRVQRLDDEVHQGRGWIIHLSDRTTYLEDYTQRLAIRIRALATLLRETLSETVQRLRIWY